MRPAILALLAIVATTALLRRRHHGGYVIGPPTEDPMAVPFLDSRNSATYLYNARTGVVTSYN